MSLHMNSMNSPIKKFIFIGLTETQINLVRSLKGEFNLFTDKFYWIFMQNTEDLIYHVDQKTLLISHDAECRKMMGIMYKLGHPFLLTWNDFLRFFYFLISINSTVQERHVCLAFIPENFMKIYSSLLHLYGFKVSVVNHPIELEALMETGIDYLVFDLDMNQLPEKGRLTLMQKIRYYCKKGLMASVIKNFDMGSLFNDILSPVKEISNLLLSPEEYTIFLRKYLYVKDTESFEKGHPFDFTILNQTNTYEDLSKYGKTHPYIFSDLRDAKKKYSEIQSLKMNQDWSQNLLINGSTHLRFMLSGAVETFISENFESGQRELFTFFPK